MSEPDDPRWLNEVGEELRREVPVRAAWRARLLDDVARSRRPTAGDDFDDRDVDAMGDGSTRARDRRIVLSPLTGIAAAVVFAVVGAGGAVATLSLRERSADDGASLTTTSRGTAAAPSPAPVASAERETVQFELSAPQASHVALVGSFNEWNPVATPLRRDASTGKWIVSLRLPPGRHVYAFVVDGDVTADPTAPRAADADFGSANSVVLVAGKSS
jgi:hypothetical protein